MPRKRKAGNGEGSVSRVKGKNLWRATVTRILPDGRRKRETKYAATQAAANELRRRMLSGGPVPTAGTGRVSFATTLERYFAVASVKSSTLCAYKGVASRYLIPALGLSLTSRLTAEQIAGVIDGIGRSSSTRQHALTVVRVALEQAVKDGVIATNPAKSVQWPATSYKEHRVWSVEQCLTFMEVSSGSYYHPIFVVAIATGLRQGEILGLRMADVDLGNSTLTVRRRVYRQDDGVISIDSPKSRKSRRTVTIPQFALDVLRVHFARRRYDGADDDDWVFPSRWGGTISQPNLLAGMKRLIERATLPPITFHELRHTSLSILLQSGENVKVVQERAGHANVSTTLNIYGHVMPGMQKGAADRLESVFTERETNGREQVDNADAG